MRSACSIAAAAALFSLAAACQSHAQTQPTRDGDDLVFPEGAQVPRSMTPVEAKYIAEFPLAASTRAVTPPPSGPVLCAPEYGPMAAIMMSWEGTSSWLAILAQMTHWITTDGAADAYIVVDSAGEQTSAASTIQSWGADMNRVRFIVRTTDTIWVRDYGPRFVYQGGCRAIVDHTYNRPRPNDNSLSGYFAPLWGFALYELPLVHGGGNFHLNSPVSGHATRLINNENPSYTEAQITGIWHDYLNLDTQLYTPFPTSVDLTQHIDMWMQEVDDQVVVISDWPLQQGSTQDQICDQAAALLEGRGWTVYRVPARTLSGTHYTYTNVVVCNDLVLVPSYTASGVSQYNAVALAAWQAVYPEKTIRQINAQAIVTSAGVLHCIVMHVPAHLGGTDPTAYLVSPRGGDAYDPGEQVVISWISDDDEAVDSVDILLSLDGGQTFPTTIAADRPRIGSYNWTVPDAYSQDARIRIVAADEAARTGHDEAEAGFIINGTPPCPGDFDGSGSRDTADFFAFFAGFFATPPNADYNADGATDTSDFFLFFADFFTPCP